MQTHAPSENLTITTTQKPSTPKTKKNKNIDFYTSKLDEADDFATVLTEVCFAVADGVEQKAIDIDELMGGVCDAGEKHGLKRIDTAKQFREALASVKKMRQKNKALTTTDASRRKPINQAGDYEERSSGLYHWRNSRDGLILAHLTNFTAKIVSDVIEDDGQETKRFFELEAQQGQRKSTFLVAADEFNSIAKWATENLGAKAVIFPRQNDYARCAVQMLSPNPKERRVFTHTGWRVIDKEPFYLHGGGAIGKDSVNEFEVRLPDSLTPAILPTPPKNQAWRDALSSIFDLMELAPDEIIIPALGAVWSSVIGHVDFSIWLYGTTGSGKSQLAALMQSFFGQFNADKLPGSWMSTGNALEGIAHAAKDMIFVVDDFKPAGSAQDRARLQKEADRLLRAQGNQAGRQRLTADTTQRKTKFPRGLIFNTAEEVPQGESLVARLFVLETQKSSIDFDKLSGLQAMAANGIFATAMSGFIRWLAIHHTTVIHSAKQAIAERRDVWAQKNIASHRRYATTLGHLEYGWDLWIRAAQDAKFMNAAEAQNFASRINSALSIAGGKQDTHTNTQNPVTRFMELLSSALTSQSAYLELRDGGMPPTPTMMGWRKINDHYEPKGERIGWFNPDDDELFLIPDAAYRMIEKHASHGVGVGVQATTLWKQLFEAQIIKCKEDGKDRRGYPVRRRIEGKQVSVLVFDAQKTLGYIKNDDSDDSE